MSHENPGDNLRCDWCDRPGQPYEYKGVTFSGLTACEGDRLCPRCRDRYLDREVTEAVARTPVTVIAARYRIEYADRPKRHTRWACTTLSVPPESTAAESPPERTPQCAP